MRACARRQPASHGPGAQVPSHAITVRPAPTVRSMACHPNYHWHGWRARAWSDWKAVPCEHPSLASAANLAAHHSNFIWTSSVLLTSWWIRWKLHLNRQFSDDLFHIKWTANNVNHSVKMHCPLDSIHLFFSWFRSKSINNFLFINRCSHLCLYFNVVFDKFRNGNSFLLCHLNRSSQSSPWKD